MGLIIYLTGLIILGVKFETVFCHSQGAVLYSQLKGAGDNLDIFEDYVANLTTQHFDDRTQSVCVTGIWLFYEDPNFNPEGNRGMEYIFGQDNYCVNLGSLAGDVSSVRYAGAPQDYHTDSLTLYEYTFFQGREEYTLHQLPNLYLKGKPQSLIIAGHSDWTVYDQPEYQGNAFCLQLPEPGKDTPLFLYDLEETNIGHGFIQSVRKGCEKEDRKAQRKMSIQKIHKNHYVF